MQLCSTPPAPTGSTMTVTVTAALVLMLTLSGSCHPVQEALGGPPGSGVVFMEQVSRLGVGIHWRNITCKACKAVFIMLDIALLVRIMCL